MNTFAIGSLPVHFSVAKLFNFRWQYTDVQFVRTDFGSLIFYTADISASKFVHCEIMHCDFTYAHFRNVSMEFKNTKLMNVQIQYFDSLELKYTADTTSNTISL